MPRKSVGKEAVTPRPFALRTEARGEVTQEREQERVRQQQQHEDELRHFHARSAAALKTPAFCATKSLKPLTEMEHVTSGRRETWPTPPYPHTPHTPPHSPTTLTSVSILEFGQSFANKSNMFRILEQKQPMIIGSFPEM